MRFSISRMTEHDLLEVVEIEEISGLSPWGWDAYHKELHESQGATMLVARILTAKTGLASGKGIAGFIVSRMVADEIHVNNVAVRPEFRQRGIGTKLLRFALQKGREAGAQVAFLEVRVGNLAAQALYRSAGFAATGQRLGYYHDPLEDALLMSLSL